MFFSQNSNKEVFNYPAMSRSLFSDNASMGGHLNIISPSHSTVAFDHLPEAELITQSKDTLNDSKEQSRSFY